jgi:hypothetical protein
MIEDPGAAELVGLGSWQHGLDRLAAPRPGRWLECWDPDEGLGIEGEVRRLAFNGTHAGGEPVDLDLEHPGDLLEPGPVGPGRTAAPDVVHVVARQAGALGYLHLAQRQLARAGLQPIGQSARHDRPLLTAHYVGLGGIDPSPSSQ